MLPQLYRANWSLHDSPGYNEYTYYENLETVKKALKSKRGYWNKYRTFHVIPDYKVEKLAFNKLIWKGGDQMVVWEEVHGL